MTKARLALVEVLFDRREPLSVAEILSALRERGVVVNKTTAYRELEFLIDRGLVTKVLLDGVAVRYELTDAGHHHHLVCVRCSAVQDLPSEGDLTWMEQAILRSTGFSVASHSLEFFGTCRACSA